MWPYSWRHSPCSQDPPPHWPSDCGRSGASPRKLANIGLHPTWGYQRASYDLNFDQNMGSSKIVQDPCFGDSKYINMCVYIYNYIDIDIKFVKAGTRNHSDCDSKETGGF